MYAQLVITYVRVCVFKETSLCLCVCSQEVLLFCMYTYVCTAWVDPACACVYEGDLN